MGEFKEYLEIINDVDIIIELERRDLNGKFSGDNYMIPCPYHNDSNPSFGIRLKTREEYGKVKPKGLFNCLGCGERGNFFHLISYIDDIEFEDAIRLFKKDEINVK